MSVFLSLQRDFLGNKEDNYVKLNEVYGSVRQGAVNQSQILNRTFAYNLKHFFCLQVFGTETACVTFGTSNLLWLTSESC